jgi:plasmid stabilization system protein ParE
LPEVKFSRLAESDLQSIDEYTSSNWNADQADLYLNQIKAFCLKLARTPAMGRPVSQRSGLRRIEYKAHVIFYRGLQHDILISRILLSRILPERRSFDGLKAD